ncbi:MAG TPA: hypothetical protein VMV94_02970 [Phycisphaerae bacterium]|nr:hypothetical protein [Phycisphaerae bacterium]
MAIQFLCSACGQPIEVDDDMANLPVTCPYCRKVVMTPEKSNLSARPDVVAAGAVPGEATPPTPTPAMLTPPPRRSVLGWIALACVILCIVSAAYSVLSLYSIFQGVDLKQMKQDEIQKMSQERMQGRLDVQIAGIFGFCAFPLVGLTCAIVALVIGAKPRWPAITAICLLGAILLLSCAGVMMQAAAARAPAS